MLKYVHVFFAVMLLNILTITAFAATVQNTDLKIQSLTIVEGSAISNVSLNPHQTVTICMKGCFVTFPNKDRFAVKAEDNIKITEGRAIFK
ncbi:hypothetical protein [Bartonella quintana]|uniref:Organic solvent tolerance-like N-terminal domain-containing protein n=3 Tax=Bartonella quintana TaxID=803 RepID=A0A0H3LW17_BARQU|nr:hypothetical protein [Bartonella quintana]ETS13244.1 hypothetical protein Q651_00196 [Bartonella quintana BQ2-D70]ETS14099.1 hypothetical protein Q650_00720 [Bartonella quintana JK 73rel]ETS15786.1 hypothetical protein Q649_00729 [Bartonella quintana JK 73]ETS17789.1 hypothetical protein Q647_00718 [Bartonella quintana JK 7]ETS18618.1 hypothetical protein Q648_00307 [Bartonella quintana JK 12]